MNHFRTYGLRFDTATLNIHDFVYFLASKVLRYEQSYNFWSYQLTNVALQTWQDSMDCSYN